MRNGNIQEIRDSSPFFFFVVHKISIKIYFHASIDRLATLHRVFRNTIVVPSHYLFSVDKFATRIRHKIHCACNDYANLPEMQRRGLIAINLNNDRGGSSRKIVCAKTEAWIKKSVANITGTTYKPVQIADISLFSLIANHFGESRDRMKAIIFYTSCWNWLRFSIQLRSFILFIYNYSNNPQNKKDISYSYSFFYYEIKYKSMKLNKFNSSFIWWWTNRIQMKVWLFIKKKKNARKNY